MEGHLRQPRDCHPQGQGRHEGQPPDRRIPRGSHQRQVRRETVRVQHYLSGRRRGMEDHRRHRGRAHHLLERRDPLGRDPAQGCQVDPLCRSGRRGGRHRGSHWIPTGQEVLQKGPQAGPGGLRHPDRPKRTNGDPGRKAHGAQPPREGILLHRGVQAGEGEAISEKERRRRRRRRPPGDRHAETPEPEHRAKGGDRRRRSGRRCRDGCGSGARGQVQQRQQKRRKKLGRIPARRTRSPGGPGPGPHQLHGQRTRHHHQGRRRPERNLAGDL
mmetsp:Transcript_3278/g.9079  ORF Transcript_3278/g.9079 Transcript_3278/m.9079 type:complete len:272 (+) Transcript_3278:930-1745(+)